MRKTLLAILITVVACKSSDADNQPQPAPVTASPGSETATADPVVLPEPVIVTKTWYPIPELGIQVEVPGAPTHEVVVTDVYSVNAPGCDFQIGKAYEGDEYYEETLQTLKKNMARITVEGFSKKEKNADGTFSIEAALKTKLGPMWYLQNRVKIDGTALTIFSCASEAMKTSEHAACVSHACASAKKL